MAWLAACEYNDTWYHWYPESKSTVPKHRHKPGRTIKMGISTATAPQPRPLEDPLAHLPCSTIMEYRKGQTIYSHDQPSTSIYLVIDGKVKVCRLADDGRQVGVDIYQPDEFFGESAFLGLAQRTELAVALENTKLMTWTTSELEDIATRRPKLAISLLQLLVKRSMDFGSRIES